MTEREKELRSDLRQCVRMAYTSERKGEELLRFIDKLIATTFIEAEELRDQLAKLRATP